MHGVDDINLKTLLEHAHIGVVIHRWDTSIAYANPTALTLLRLSYEQIIGKDAFDPQWSFLDEAGRKLLIEDYPVNKVKSTSGRLENEVIGVVDSSRSEISWFLINAYLEGGPSDDNRFIVVTFNDISDSKKLFSFEDIVKNTQDVVIVTEAESIEHPFGPKIIYVNQAFEELTGYKQEEVIGETPRLLQGPLTDPKAKKRIYTALQNNQAVSETLLNYDIKGRPYWIDMNIIPLKNKYGEVTHFAAIERDVSEKRFYLEQLEKRNADLRLLKNNLEKIVDERTLELQKAKSQLEKIAFFDPLTKLPNRRYFIDQATKIIKSSSRRNLLIGFGVLDIDDFKLLNDNYGHDVGDKVLVELGQFLNKFFRGDDAFCRYGGEEFAFAVLVDHENAMTSLANRLITGIQSLQVIVAPDCNLKITASLGVKISAAKNELDLEKEIKQADIALYQSKKEGKNKATII